ncbi:hypothetical protein HDA40_005525 [Hamadaea flava]|uniref:Uncharacterized protein n=1 Tax=Hamadaea flava TaxID=1742688 RepID=A0ABV8LZK6_9ACTN|nr:hypothetical protein [Hamadaea flava]MCP2327018.1 hypothetical protein [Hamadaea flava]
MATVNRLGWRGLTAIFLSASVSMGCSSHDQKTQSNVIEPSIGVLAPVSSVSSISLPLDAYRLSSEQKLLDAQAQDLLMSDCMHKAGASLEGESVTYSVAVNEYVQKQRDNSFGLVDESKAQQFGYHGEPMPIPEEKQYSPSPAMSQCSAEVKQSMAEKAPSVQDFSKSFRLPDEAVARTRNDSRYLAMARRWSDCMKDKGYVYDSPESAATDSNWPTSNPSASEVQTATADVRCKAETDYLPLVVALRTAYEIQLLEENAEALQRVKEYYDRRTRLVAGILAGK